MNLLDQLFDPENMDPVVLYNKRGEAVSFEQIALVPLGEDVYVILQPTVPMEGVGEDEGIVFKIEDVETEAHLALVTYMEIVDAVFDIYEQLCEEE
jgi:hypothetical protein